MAFPKRIRASVRCLADILRVPTDESETGGSLPEQGSAVDLSLQRAALHPMMAGDTCPGFF